MMVVFEHLRWSAGTFLHALFANVFWRLRSCFQIRGKHAEARAYSSAIALRWIRPPSLGRKSCDGRNRERLMGALKNIGVVLARAIANNLNLEKGLSEFRKSFARA
jgi:hypothetical protein